MLPNLFSRPITAPTSAAPATIKITLEESAASGTTIAGLHMLPFVAFGTATSANSWSAQVAFPYPSVQL